MTPRNLRVSATTLAAFALVALAGCTIEVNINTDPDGAPESPIVTVRPDAPEAPAPTTPARPEAPPLPEAAPSAPWPPIAPERAEADRDAVRNLLFLFRSGAEETREPEQRAAPPPDPADGPTFTPFTKAPSILNRDEVIEALRRAYPPLLREAGIEGTTQVFFFIDETGDVRDSRIAEASGHEALDDAALSVAGVYRFSPALNRDEPVPVWVRFPITFRPAR